MPKFIAIFSEGEGFFRAFEESGQMWTLQTGWHTGLGLGLGRWMKSYDTTSKRAENLQQCLGL